MATGNPGVWGTAGPLPRTGNPGVWGTAGPTTSKPRTVTASNAASAVQGYDPYASAMSQTDQIIAALLADVQRQQDSARATAMQEAALEAEKGRALAYGLQQLGIADTINRIFQSAGSNQANLAQGFSGQIRQQASEQAAQQQQALLGTGQEGAVRNQGENMGNVAYGLGGSIPGTELSTLGAAYGAQAALEPGFAMQFGQLAEAARRQEWAKELAAFAEQKADVLAKKPDTFLDLVDKLGLNDTGGTSSSSTKLTSRTLANGQVQWYDPYTGKPVGKPTGPTRASKGADAPNLQAKRLANGQYVAWDPATGKQVGKPWGPTTKKGSGSGSDAPGSYNLQMKNMGTYTQAWDPRTGKFVGPRYPVKSNKTPAAARGYAKDAGKIALKAWNGVKVTQTNENGEKVTGTQHLSYQEAMREGLAQGIPLEVMQKALNRFWTKPGFDRDFITGKWIKSGRGRPTRSYQDRSGVTPTPAGLSLPSSWSGTHVTDGLGWGTQTAEDIMGNPGTPVRAPESGRIVKHGSAQGGQSVWFLSDSGYMYWLGHIESDLPVGTRIRRGQKLAVISADHPRPHVHIDKKPWTDADVRS